MKKVQKYSLIYLVLCIFLFVGGYILMQKNTSLPENGSALDPDIFQQLAQNPEWTVIDIRNEREMREYGVIPGTDIQKNVYNQHDVKFLENLDPDGKYLIYCFHGNRSFYLKEYLIKEFSFTNIYDLAGGIDAWKNNGYEVQKYEDHHM